MEIRAMNMN